MSLPEVWTIGLIAGTGIVLFFYIVQPLRETRSPEELASSPVETLAELYAQHDALYQAIKELDVDHQVGKVCPEDYTCLRERLQQEAASILRRIDELQAQETSIRERLEATVRKLREEAVASHDGPSLAGFPLPRAPRFCTQCGAQLRSGDRFCSQCGAAVLMLWHDPAHRAGEV